MLKRGVTGIVFSKSGQNNFFLLLHRCLNWSGWEFVKGGIEGSEAPEQAVMREIEEERNIICYGKRKPKDRIEKLITSFNKLREIINNELNEYKKSQNGRKK